MYRSPFGQASWMCLGGAVLWILWILALASGEGRSETYDRVIDACGIFPISGTLCIVGIVCGIIGLFQSGRARSNCMTAIVVNVMFLIVLALYSFF